jgi:hypothetical protein
MKSNVDRSRARASLKVTTAIRGGRLAQNHSPPTSLNVKTAIRGGRLAANHIRRAI